MSSKISPGLVKSIQRIAGTNSVTATISAVNTAKTVIHHTGAYYGVFTDSASARFVLSSSTQVTVVASAPGGAAYSAWAADVVEYW